MNIIMDTTLDKTAIDISQSGNIKVVISNKPIDELFVSDSTDSDPKHPVAKSITVGDEIVIHIHDGSKALNTVIYRIMNVDEYVIDETAYMVQKLVLRCIDVSSVSSTRKQLEPVIKVVSAIGRTILVEFSAAVPGASEDAIYEYIRANYGSLEYFGKEYFLIDKALRVSMDVTGDTITDRCITSMLCVYTSHLPKSNKEIAALVQSYSKSFNTVSR